MANKETKTHSYNMSHDFDENECNVTNSDHDSEHVLNIDVNEEHHDNNSILSVTSDEDSIQAMNDMDTMTFLDTIENNCLMEYLQYTNFKKDKTTDNISDIMIAAIKLLTIIKNAKASLSLYSKIIDWVLY